MILSDARSGHPWDNGVSVLLDKATGKYSISLNLYENNAPGTMMALDVNGQKIDTFILE